MILMLVGAIILTTAFVCFTSLDRLWLFVAVSLFSLGNGLMWPSFLAILSRVAGDKHQGFYDPQFLLLDYYLENQPKFIGIDNYTKEGFEFMDQGMAIGLDTFRRALAKRVKIVFGSDALGGLHGKNHEEFVYRVRDGGQDPMDAIISATSRAAESLGLENQLGTLAPGMEADIIATAGNPIEDITSVKDVMFVMKGGRVYKNHRPARGKTEPESQ